MVKTIDPLLIQIGVAEGFAIATKNAGIYMHLYIGFLLC